MVLKFWGFSLGKTIQKAFLFTINLKTKQQKPCTSLGIHMAQQTFYQAWNYASYNSFNRSKKKIK